MSFCSLHYGSSPRGARVGIGLIPRYFYPLLTYLICGRVDSASAKGWRRELTHNSPFRATVALTRSIETNHGSVVNIFGTLSIGVAILVARWYLAFFWGGREGFLAVIDGALAFNFSRWSVFSRCKNCRRRMTSTLFYRPLAIS